MNGAVVLDKPKGWTSHDAVNKIRRLAGTRKVGHLGTLDPMATGVLPLLLNRATRLAQFFTRAGKAYDATVRFGFATDTYDAEGKAVSPMFEPAFSRDDLETWLDRFRGTFAQTPPAVSAKKIAGTPAYKLARRDIAVELAAVQVTMTRLTVERFALPEVDLCVECSAGTYVRSLAHDLGLLAGCGAHLSALRRTRSGEFTLTQARTIEELEANFASAIVPASRLLPDLPEVHVDAITAAQIRNGREFRSEGDAVLVRAISPDGELLAIGKRTALDLCHPTVVL
jgi:tRNA pseudouridine55 synthase